MILFALLAHHHINCPTTSCTRPDARDLEVCESGCGRVMMGVGQRVRAALPADIDSMAGTAGSLNLRIWADQGMQARATGPRHMAVRGSRLRYACRPMGNDPPESHHNQGHPDLHARSTVHTRRSEVASGGFTEPPTL